jgi:hypothetical protein
VVEVVTLKEGQALSVLFQVLVVAWADVMHIQVIALLEQVEVEVVQDVHTTTPRILELVVLGQQIKDMLAETVRQGVIPLQVVEELVLWVEMLRQVEVTTKVLETAVLAFKLILMEMIIIMAVEVVVSDILRLQILGDTEESAAVEVEVLMEVVRQVVRAEVQHEIQVLTEKTAILLMEMVETEGITLEAEAVLVAAAPLVDWVVLAL